MLLPSDAATRHDAGEAATVPAKMRQNNWSLLCGFLPQVVGKIGGCDNVGTATSVGGGGGDIKKKTEGGNNKKN